MEHCCFGFDCSNLWADSKCATGVSRRTGRSVHSLVHSMRLGVGSLAVMVLWIVAQMTFVVLWTTSVQAQSLNAGCASSISESEARQRLKGDPSVQKVRRGVLSKSFPSRTQQAMTWAAVLPKQLQVRLSGHDEGDWSDTVYEEDGWRRRLGGESQLGWRVALEWDLSRLVYHPHHLVLDRIEFMKHRTQQQAEDEAIQLYYERRRLQWSWLTDRLLTEPQCARLWWKIRELAARLDVMTNGVFRTHDNPWWREVAGGSGHP